MAGEAVADGHRMGDGKLVGVQRSACPSVLVHQQQVMDSSMEAFNANSHFNVARGRSGRVAPLNGRKSLTSFNASYSNVIPHHELGVSGCQINYFEFADEDGMSPLLKAPPRDKVADFVGPKPNVIERNLRTLSPTVEINSSPSVNMDLDQQPNFLANPTHVAYEPPGQSPFILGSAHVHDVQSVPSPSLHN